MTTEPDVTDVREKVVSGRDFTDLMRRTHPGPALQQQGPEMWGPFWTSQLHATIYWCDGAAMNMQASKTTNGGADWQRFPYD